MGKYWLLKIYITWDDMLHSTWLSCTRSLIFLWYAYLNHATQRDQWQKDTYMYFDNEMIQNLNPMIDTKGPYLCELYIRSTMHPHVHMHNHIRPLMGIQHGTTVAGASAATQIRPGPPTWVAFAHTLSQGHIHICTCTCMCYIIHIFNRRVNAYFLFIFLHL